MLFQCWPIVLDAAPALKQHLVNALCLLGYHLTCEYIYQQITDQLNKFSSISFCWLNPSQQKETHIYQSLMSL